MYAMWRGGPGTPLATGLNVIITTCHETGIGFLRWSTFRLLVKYVNLLYILIYKFWMHLQKLICTNFLLKILISDTEIIC